MKTPSEDGAFICIDCQADTLRTWEYYMVHDEVWEQAVTDGTGRINNADGMLCIGCLEKRLGRRVSREDFTDCPLNVEMENKPRSLRLAHRLGIVPAVVSVVDPPRSIATMQPTVRPVITIENTEFAHMQANGRVGIVLCAALAQGIKDARSLKT